MAQIGTIRVDTQNNGTVSVPVFETGDSGSSIYEFVRVQTGSGTGFIPVVDPTDASFPYLRVQSQNNGVVAVHNESSLFTVFDFTTFIEDDATNDVNVIGPEEVEVDATRNSDSQLYKSISSITSTTSYRFSANINNTSSFASFSNLISDTNDAATSNDHNNFVALQFSYTDGGKIHFKSNVSGGSEIINNTDDNSYGRIYFDIEMNFETGNATGAVYNDKDLTNELGSSTVPFNTSATYDYVYPVSTLNDNFSNQGIMDVDLYQAKLV